MRATGLSMRQVQMLCSYLRRRPPTACSVIMSCMIQQSLADAPAALPQINTWLSNTRIRIWRPTLQALTDPGDLHVAARPPSCAGPPDQAGGGWERGWRPQ